MSPKKLRRTLKEYDARRRSLSQLQGPRRTRRCGSFTGGVRGKHPCPSLSDTWGNSGAVQTGPPSPSLDKTECGGVTARWCHAVYYSTKKTCKDKPTPQSGVPRLRRPHHNASDHGDKLMTSRTSTRKHHITGKNPHLHCVTMDPNTNHRTAE